MPMDQSESLSRGLIRLMTATLRAHVAGSERICPAVDGWACSPGHRCAELLAWRSVVSALRSAIIARSALQGACSRVAANGHLKTGVTADAPGAVHADPGWDCKISWVILAHRGLECHRTWREPARVGRYRACRGRC